MSFNFKSLIKSNLQESRKLLLENFFSVVEEDKQKRTKEEIIVRYKKNKDRIDWSRLSSEKKLPIWFIEEFKDYVDWSDISHYQNLPENFIREYQNRVDWFNISSYQNLSIPFIHEFHDKLDMEELVDYNKNIPEEIRMKLKYQEMNDRKESLKPIRKVIDI